MAKPGVRVSAEDLQSTVRASNWCWDADGQELVHMLRDGELSAGLCNEADIAFADDDSVEDQSVAESAAEGISAEACSCVSTLRRTETVTFSDRLSRAVPALAISSRIAWSRLVAAEATEALESAKDDMLGDDQGVRQAVCVEVNSGGQVFFGLLESEGHEEAVVMKFCNSRHLLQSEQMAAELAWHLEVAAPASRVLLRAHDAEEWRELERAAEAVCASLAATLSRKQSMLLLQFVPGASLQREKDAWSRKQLSKSAHALGRLLVLDLLLGNADRLPVHALSWRGNPSNVLWGAPGTAVAGQCVPIDAAVARRPPKLLVQETDQKAECLLELVLLDRESAHATLLDAVSCNKEAVAAVRDDWAPTEAAWLERESGQPTEQSREQSAVKAFHEGVKAALELTLREQGLLEMVAEVLQSWLDTLRDDMAQVSKASWALLASRTKQLQDLTREAARNSEVQERLGFWQDLLLEKSRILAQAAVDWASRRQAHTALSFRGFLGDSVLNPVADAYELLVRLRQLIARGKVMAAAGHVTRPSDLSPSPLLVGPVTACCFHLLRKLGVTLVVNCTSDLPAPSQEELGDDIRWHRLALEDVEEQDLSSAFEEGLRLIDEVREAGGRALVHCHEGKSRSVSLCLAYMVARERRSLSDSLAFVKARRPQSRPNAGFLKQLLALELSVLGSNSMAPDKLPTGKPRLGEPFRRRASKDTD